MSYCEEVVIKESQSLVVITKRAGDYVTISDAETGEELAYVSATKKGSRSNQVKIYVIKKEGINVSRKSPILTEEFGNENQGD